MEGKPIVPSDVNSSKKLKCFHTTTTIHIWIIIGSRQLLVMSLVLIVLKQHKIKEQVFYVCVRVFTFFLAWRFSFLRFSFSSSVISSSAFLLISCRTQKHWHINVERYLSKRHMTLPTFYTKVNKIEGTTSDKL